MLDERHDCRIESQSDSWELLKGPELEHSIERTPQGLRITASVTPRKQQDLLDEFAKCAAVTCSCPTPQYEKLESMDVSTQLASVMVNLKVK